MHCYSQFIITVGYGSYSSVLFDTCLSYNLSNAVIVLADFMCSGRLFHGFTTLLEKKFLRTSLVALGSTRL